MEILLLQLSLVSYLVATIGFVVHLTSMQEFPRRLAVWALSIAFGLHTAALVARSISLGHAPIASFHDELSILGWLIVGLFLALQRYYALAVLGGLVSPFAFLLVLSAYLVYSGADALPRNLQR